MKEGNVIERLDDLPFYFIDCNYTPCHAEMELCRFPILFDKVKLTMVFWIEITQMAARLDQLLKLGLLRYKVRLQKENTPAATVSMARGAMKTRALGKKFSLAGPQTTLPNNDLHAFEPAGHGGVVFRKIKRLGLASWKSAAAHAWTVRLMRPPFLRPCERSQLDSAGHQKSCGMNIYCP